MSTNSYINIADTDLPTEHVVSAISYRLSQFQVITFNNTNMAAARTCEVGITKKENTVLKFCDVITDW